MEKDTRGGGEVCWMTGVIEKKAPYVWAYREAFYNARRSKKFMSPVLMAMRIVLKEAAMQYFGCFWYIIQTGWKHGQEAMLE